MIQHFSNSPDLSRDPFKYPAIAWGAQDQFAHQNLFVSFPTDSGFGIGEQLESVTDGILPTIVRDANGDAWVAWWKYFDGAFWIHSYTTATCSAPAVVGAGRRRSLVWTLSEPAPETWWAVLRARGEGEFELAGRVRAGAGQEMSWTDTSPPAGVLRYRIRRECVDKRYEWLSGEARWPARSRKPLLVPLSANPVTTRVEFEIVDAAAGALRVTLYDLQGRRVAGQQVVARGAASEVMALDWPSARLPSGVYLLRAVDAGGQESQVVKLVVLQ
jgi:hypothetical protein